MDARRNQVYTGIYKFVDNRFQVVKEQTAIGIEEVLEEINTLGKKVIFLGDGTAVYREIIEAKMQVPYSFAPVHLSRQRAGAIGALGMELFKKEQFETAAMHEPVYLRVSQAERERAEKLQQQG
jgi:tRNA threonylcarbamoyladenosine biosynthesis protein TsaB